MLAENRAGTIVGGDSKAVHPCDAGPAKDASQKQVFIRLIKFEMIPSDLF